MRNKPLRIKQFNFCVTGFDLGMPLAFAELPLEAVNL